MASVHFFFINPLHFSFAKTDAVMETQAKSFLQNIFDRHMILSFHTLAW